MSFAEKVEALSIFFGEEGAKPLVARVEGWNTAMGLTAIGPNGLAMPLPQQVDELCKATGVTVESRRRRDEPAPLNNPVMQQYLDKARARAPVAVGESSAQPSDALGTSLGGIGTRADPKLSKFMDRHAARTPQPIINERAQKIAALRTLFEGGKSGPDRYKHADHLPANEEGTLPTQIAGGISYSASQVQDWESPSFFKEVATVQATKPIMRRDNPVGGKYPQFR
jgi:hypothetical protein